MKWGKLFNRVVVALLDSPLHMILSGSMAVIEYTGRKSGKTYRVPVEYVRDGDTLDLSRLGQRQPQRHLRRKRHAIPRRHRSAQDWRIIQ